MYLAIFWSFLMGLFLGAGTLGLMLTENRGFGFLIILSAGIFGIVLNVIKDAVEDLK